MPEYRLFHFKGDHIERADNLSAHDDLDAVGKAAQLVDGKVAELWRSGRKIKTFNPKH
jgi:hypothetical protein